jgi:hypothetical protein
MVNMSNDGEVSYIRHWNLRETILAIFSGGVEVRDGVVGSSNTAEDGGVAAGKGEARFGRGIEESSGGYWCSLRMME